jgi:hypothetical protein
MVEKSKYIFGCICLLIVLFFLNTDTFPSRRLFCTLNESGQYEDWDGISKKHPDSIVHRFNRKFGFKRTRTEEEEADVNDSSFLQQSQIDVDQHVFNPASSDHRRTSYGQLECWAKKLNPDGSFARHLAELENTPPDAPRHSVTPIQPHATLLVAYMQHLRLNGVSNEGVEGRCNKVNSILRHLKCISGTCREIGAGLITRSPDMVKLLTQWDGEDEEARA